MKTAHIINRSRKTLTLRDHDKKTYHYVQGQEVELPPVIHAPIIWEKGEDPYKVEYSGDILPEVLVVRDGGVTRFHEYNRSDAA